MKSAFVVALIAVAACATRTAGAVPAMSLAPTHSSALDFSADGFDAAIGQVYKLADTGKSFFDEFTFTVDGTTFEGGFKATTQVATSALTIYDFDLYTSAGIFITGVSAGDANNNWAIALTALDKGDYVLEVNGLVTGVAGGRYGGAVSLDPPLPEPATLGMLAGGLAVMGLLRRRRHPAPPAA